jgi:hypothetical protein
MRSRVQKAERVGWPRVGQYFCCYVLHTCTRCLVRGATGEVQARESRQEGCKSKRADRRDADKRSAHETGANQSGAQH